MRYPTRRSFMGSALAIAAANLTIGSAPTRARAQTGKPGGRLRLGCGGASTTDSLNPSIGGATTFTYVMNGHLRSTLVDVDAATNAVPALAESWSAEPGAQIWRFKLRKGVLFHNGRPFTAQDVIWNVNYHRGPESKSSLRRQMSDIVDMTVDGDDLVFKLSAGNADFPYLLADSKLAIVPADTSEADFEKGIGTGPFVLTEYTAGVKAVAKRNPAYWRTGLPYFDEIEIIAINDSQSRINALLSGQVDAINRVDPRIVASLQANKAITIVPVTGDYHYSLAARADLPPFDNVDVRLAVKYAIDRELVLKNVLRGYGDLGNDHPISKRNIFFNTELPQRKYDPDQAAFHLKKSGFTGTLPPYSVSAGVYQGALDLAAIFQQSAQKAGIKITIDQVPNDGYFDNIWKKRPWFANYSSGRPTADGILSLIYAKGAQANESFWANDRFETILKEARIEVDQSKRKALYWEAQTILNQDAATIIPVFPQFIHAASAKLRFETVAGDREFDGAKIGERWWFA
jgi:peptide/nickel transport system substrate-binding protein